MDDICENCKTGQYKEVDESYFEAVNPNGEFVHGYGQTVVSIQKHRTIIQCPICGHKKGQKILNLDIK